MLYFNLSFFIVNIINLYFVGLVGNIKSGGYYNIYSNYNNNRLF